MSKTTSRSLSLAHLTVLEATPPQLVTLASDAGFDQVGLRIYANPSVGATPYNLLGDTPMMRETSFSETGMGLEPEPRKPVTFGVFLIRW